MISESVLRDIFAKITEHYQTPLRLSSVCETNTFYQVEDLSEKDVELCADYISERIIDICGIAEAPEVLINMHKNQTALATKLAEKLSEQCLIKSGEKIQVISLEKVEAGNGVRNLLTGRSAMLVNDVITTARSCLEAHSKTTLMGAKVMCWAALIDRTFGPGPVPVVAAFTGEPVTLLQKI